MGSGFNFFIDATDVTPGTLDAWTDVDVSASIPSGSTGVILDLHAVGVAQNYLSVRKNGSTDDRSASHKLESNRHRYAWIGVDANRVFEAKIDTAEGKIYLVGYTDDSMSFETNGVDKSLSTTGSWVDIASGAPSGFDGVIVEIVDTTTTAYIGTIRKNGSTDNRTASSKIHPNNCIYALCGLDADGYLEGYIENVAVDFYVIGYTKAPIAFFTNAIDKSLGVVDTWTDIDLTADTEATADGAIFQIYHTGTTAVRKAEFRKNGSTDDRYASSYIRISGHIWAGVGLDADNICEGIIEATATDFYLMGYCKPAATYVNVSDSGSGVDTLAALEASMVIAESGSGLDAPSLQAQLSLSDSGMGSDVLQSIGTLISDSGAGTDSPALEAQLSISETGLGSEVWTKSEIAAFTGIIRSVLSILEGDMIFELKEVSMTLESLERKMEMELIE